MTGVSRVFRQLTRTPAFTVPVVAGLSLAIGGSTAVFSIFSAMLIRSLGVEDPARVVALWRADEEHGQKSVELSYRDWTEWRKATDVLDGIALASSVNLDLTVYVGDLPERVDSTTVTGDYFHLLGARPIAGRLLTEDDDRPGAPSRAVLSYRFWQNRLGGDFGIVGRQLRVAGGEVTVIGIAGPEFDFPRDVGIWLPLHTGWPDVERNAELRVFRGLARLRHGVSIPRARARLDALAPPDTSLRAGDRRWPTVLLTSLLDEIYGAARPAIFLLLGAVLFVLLIACANAANLLMNRAAERQHELAVRTALGANRSQLVRLLMGETAVLATVSGVLGLALSAICIRVLATLAPAGVPRIGEATLDPLALGFGIVLTGCTLLFMGVLPALLATRPDPNDALKEGGRGTSASHHQGRLRRSLIAVEGGISVMLLIGAGSMVRSFSNLSAVDPGFQWERVLTFRTTLEKPDQESRRAFYAEALTRLRALPGVESAAAVLLRPLSGAVGWDTTYAIERQLSGRLSANPNGNYEAVSPDYFRTMGIRIAAGRDFTAADTSTAPGVVIIDEITARRHWRTGEALGKRIRLGSNPKAAWLTVVGVAAPVRYREWQTQWADFYVPLTQRAQHRSDFVVKTKGDPWKLAEAVRREVLAIDKNQPVSNLTTMQALVDRTLSGSRFNSVVMSSLGLSALLLAAIGIHGVLSCVVTQRRTEIALRMALGTTPGSIVRLISNDGLIALLPGVLAGLGAGMWLQNALSKLLFGITSIDIQSCAFAVLALVATAALASTMASLRAACIDPAQGVRK